MTMFFISSSPGQREMPLAERRHTLSQLSLMTALPQNFASSLFTNYRLLSVNMPLALKKINSGEEES